MDQTVKILFWPITQEPLSQHNFHAIFEFLPKLTVRCLHNVSQNCRQFWDNTKNANSK